MTTSTTTTGLHSARQELGLPNVMPGGPPHMNHGGPHTFLHMNGGPNGAPHESSMHSLPKPLSLSPRTFGMEDLRDFCGPLGTFKTGLTPRVFSTGLTPRSGFTPRFQTGFTPRINATGLGQTPQSNDTNAFFSRNTGFSPRATEGAQKISPTGYTPKDVSGMKMPMRFPGAFANSPNKMSMGEQMHKQQQQQYHQPAHYAPQQMHLQHQQMSHNHQQHQDQMAQADMNMSMYDYLNRPGMPQASQQQQQMADSHAKVSPTSDINSDPEDLDERRRMKNRERVRKCRKRKQDRLNFLEDRTNELEKENNVLKTKLARSTIGVKAEPMSEIQLHELRKKQNTTIASYIRAYNDDETSFDAEARQIWTEQAEVSYGSNGVRVIGIDGIVANKRASSSVFAHFKIKQYSMQWKSNDKCLIHWELEAAVQPNAPTNVPMTAPFAELGAHFGADEVLTFQMTSHITFNDALISEEIRQLNLMPISEVVMAKFAQEPQEAANVLRCLLSA